MIDLYFAASPPTPVPANAVQPAPRKADERADGLDFEKVLKAKEKEVRGADVPRTAHTTRHQVRSPENGSQGEPEKVEAADRPHHEAKKIPARNEARPVQDSKEAKDPTLDETQPQDETKVDETAGAGAVQAVVAPVAAEVTALQAAAPQAAVEVSAAGLPIEAQAQVVAAQEGPKPKAAALEGAPTGAVEAAPTAAVQGEIAAVALPEAAPGFAQTLKSLSAEDGPKAAPQPNGPAAQTAAVPTPAQASAAAPAPAVVNAVAPAVQKAVKSTDGAVETASQLTAAKDGSAIQTQPAAPFSGEVKAAGNTASTQATAPRIESRALDMAQQIAKTVEASLQQGRNSLRMQLNPADLGAIDIRLVSSGHRVSMTVIAEQASTGRMIEAQVDQLRQNLADAGVQLSQLNVGQQNTGGAAGQSFAQQQAQSRPNRMVQTASGPEPELAVDRPSRLRAAGKVDYRA